MNALRTGILGLCLAGLLLAGCAAQPAADPTRVPTADVVPDTNPENLYPGPATPTPLKAYPALDTPTVVALTPVEGGNDGGSSSGAQAEEIVLTLDDSGKTLQLNVAQQFLLKLDDSYDWTIVIADQGVVARVKNVMVIKGAQGLYKALAAGQTEFSAQGEPQCRSAKPACAKPTLLFRQTIIVN